MLFQKYCVFWGFFSKWAVFIRKIQSGCLLLAVKIHFGVTSWISKIGENLLYMRIRAIYYTETYRALRGEHNFL